MREIKFRAWDKNEKIMSDTFKISDTEVYYQEGVFLLMHDDLDNIEIEIMQFTGLKDKNGKEIYEGDIVERVYDFTKSNKPLKTIDQIIYEDNWGSFAFMNKTKIGQGYSRIYSGHKVFPFEVIGNIYENPELLK